MLLNIFDYSAERKLANDLAERLLKDLPPSLMEKQRKLLSVNKVTRLLEKAYETARTYHQTNQPGFIRRAILANHFKWALRSQNYPDDFIDIATEGLVMALMNK